MADKTKIGQKSKEIKRREIHKISAMDSIRMAYNKTDDPVIKHLLEKAGMEVNKL